MEIDVALTFMRPRKQGVLTTIRRDGRPQLSNLLCAIDELVVRTTPTECCPPDRE